MFNRNFQAANMNYDMNANLSFMTGSPYSSNPSIIHNQYQMPGYNLQYGPLGIQVPQMATYPPYRQYYYPNTSMSQLMSSSTSMDNNGDATQHTTTNSNHTVNQNDNQSYLNNVLYTITSTNQFDQWIIKFTKFLRNQLPEIFTSTKEALFVGTLNDHQISLLTTIFYSHVPVNTYPTWFSKIINLQSMPLAYALLYAMRKCSSSDNSAKIKEAIKNLSFDEKTHPILLRYQYTTVKGQALQAQVTFNDKEVIENMIERLSPDYGHTKYACDLQREPYDIEHFTDLLIHKYEKLANKPVDAKKVIKTQSSKCTNCNATGHTSTNCPQKNSSNETTTKTSTSKVTKPKAPVKKKANVIQTEQTFGESPGNYKSNYNILDEDFISPESRKLVNTDDYFVIDTGADITIVKDESYLDFVNPDVTSISVKAANNTHLKLDGTGFLSFKWENDISSSLPVVISKETNYNLLSGYALRQNGLFLEERNARLTDAQGKLVADLESIDKYLCISKEYISSVFYPHEVNSAMKEPRLTSLEVLHILFGHVNI